jgi:rare lipoprotein A
VSKKRIFRFLVVPLIAGAITGALSLWIGYKAGFESCASNKILSAPVDPDGLLMLRDINRRLDKLIQGVGIINSGSIRGIASYYAEDFHGKPTSSGEKFDMYELSAAHLRLPFNTIVLVINENNGKRCLARVNDRGPFIHGRMIDVSRKVAERLDMIEEGLVPVVILPLWLEEVGS